MGIVLLLLAGRQAEVGSQARSWLGGQVRLVRLDWVGSGLIRLGGSR